MVPIHEMKTTKDCFPSWYMRHIISDFAEKDRFRFKFSDTGSLCYLDMFVNLRTDIKKRIEIAFNTFMTSAKLNIITEPSAFWSYINKQKSNQKIPNMIYYNNEVISSQGIVNTFALYFNCVYNDTNTRVLFTD